MDPVVVFGNASVDSEVVSLDVADFEDVDTVVLTGDSVRLEEMIGNCECDRNPFTIEKLLFS